MGGNLIAVLRKSYGFTQRQVLYVPYSVVNNLWIWLGLSEIYWKGDRLIGGLTSTGEVGQIYNRSDIFDGADLAMGIN